MHAIGDMRRLLFRGLIAAMCLGALAVVGCVRTTHCAQLAPVLVADPPPPDEIVISDER